MEINEKQVYTLEETAGLVRSTPRALRSWMQSGKEPFIEKAKPTKIGGKWLFLGENLLSALGSVTYKSATSEEAVTVSTAGAQSGT